MKKRIFAMLLSLTMVLAMFPATAMAETATTNLDKAETQWTRFDTAREAGELNWVRLQGLAYYYGLAQADVLTEDEETRLAALTTNIESVTELDMSNVQFPEDYNKDLGALAFFPNLKSVNVSGVKGITSFGALAKLEKLETLNISNTNASNFDFVWKDNTANPEVTPVLKNLKNITATGLTLTDINGLAHIAQQEGFNATGYNWNLSGSYLTPVSAENSYNTETITAAFKSNGTWAAPTYCHTLNMGKAQVQWSKLDAEPTWVRLQGFAYYYGLAKAEYDKLGEAAKTAAKADMDTLTNNINNVTELDMSGKQIPDGYNKDLGALAFFPNLESVDVSDVEGITNFGALAKLVNLETLNISNTSAKNFDFVWEDNTVNTETTPVLSNLKKITANGLSLTSITGLVEIAQQDGFDADDLVWDLSGSTLNDTAENKAHIAVIAEAFKDSTGTWKAPSCGVTGVSLNKTSATLTVGKTLELAANVTPEEATYTVEWASDNAEVATVDENGKVTAKKVGTATITATAGEKSATCTVTVEKKAASKPSASTGGSSSGSSSTTTTEKNPDGSSTTTQVNNATGTVTETTKNTDGSTETVKTEKDGTVTTNVAAADGTKSETVVDKSGVQTSEVTVSNKAVTEAAKAGEAVALPIPEVKATSNSSKAATVTVELPANVKSAEVEVPVANVNAGTVAVIVHADGTEEVVRNCVPTEDGIALNVANGATVKIVDNSRDFADVSAAHSFSDAVDFASARGIVEGYSNGSFGVGGYATSAATATVIARIMGEDFYGSGSTTKAQNWAKENGIAAGLDLSGNVNRVDFMTMLWRAAGSPAANTTLSFTDASSIAASAMDAMAWAVEVGLIGGYDDGSVRPNANITRGAMAAIAQRYMMAK